MKYPQPLVLWICLQFLIVSGLLPNTAQAGHAVIIGATQQQERFLACVVQLSADDLRNTPNANERMSVIVLEHQRFLELRDAFHAHKTKLAFSSLQPSVFTSLPVCSEILRRCCDALPMSWAISPPRACMKITLSALLAASDGGRDRHVVPLSNE